MSVRFVVAAVAAVVAGYLSENPQIGFAVFSAVPMVTGFRTEETYDEELAAAKSESE